MNIFGRTTDDLNIITVTDDELIMWREHVVSDSDDHILPYFHVSQKGPTAGYSFNDCGPTAICICARSNGYPQLTVDDVSKRFQQRHKNMSFAELIGGLTGYGMKHTIMGPLTPLGDLRVIDIVNNIKVNNKPVIPLVSYRALPKRFIEYRYSHYIVVYGVLSNGDLLYHDPLGDGSRLVITQDTLSVALNNTRNEGNYQNQGVLL